jgi:hypothetical protein
MNSNDEIFPSILILDWDDTLFCTSYLKKKYNNLHTDILPTDNDLISKLENEIVTILKYAMRESMEIYIITNSKQNWCESLCERFYPTLFPLLKNISIISARSHANRQEWKRNTFDSVFSKRLDECAHLTCQIICIGDSPAEHLACKYICRNRKKVLNVCIKLKKNPEIDCMLAQLEWIKNNFQSICSLKTNVYSKLNLFKKI